MIGSKILQEFKTFAIKGNMIDMAVGIIIGAAFSTVVNSLVNDVIMPPIGLLLGGVDFSDLFFTLKQGSVEGPYATLAAAKSAGAVTLNIGLFINSLISFLIVAWAVFMLVRSINALRGRLERGEEQAAQAAPPSEKNCPFCCSMISVKASKCPACTSDLPSGWAEPPAGTGTAETHLA